MDSSQVAIRFEHVTKNFGSVIALDDFSVDVRAGELLAVVGPSGCGKSTLLRVLAGLEVPDSGSVQINGIDVTHVLPGKRNIAMVFQDFPLYRHLSIGENIAYPLRIRHLPSKEVVARAAAVAELLGIDDILGRYPGEISGGQAQRVAIAKALVREPSVLLMDEPLSNLDVQLQRSLTRELRTLQRQRHLTTVFVTHDQDEAARLGDRLAVLRSGSLQQIGSLTDLQRSPNNIFVAEFLSGTPLNRYDGIISHKSGACHFKSCDGRVELRGIRVSGPLTDNASVVLAIRAEDVALGFSGDSCDLVGRVTDVQRTLRRIDILVDVGNGAPVWGRIEGESSPEIGTDVGLSFPRDRTFIFPRTV